MDHDVVIIGAGPAGSAAAAALARRGFSVLLLDKSGFPRDKTCGDGLSAALCGILDELGVWPRILEKDPWVVHRVLLSSPEGLCADCRIPRVPGHPHEGAVVPRKVLDQVLFDYAAGFPNVTAKTGFTARELIFRGGRFAGVSGEEGGRPAQVFARGVIAADGAHSVAAGKRSLKNRDPRHKAYAVRAYFENVSGLTDAIEIHYEKSVLPGYGWIFPTSATSANVGAGVSGRFSGQVNINELFETFLRKNPHAREKLAGASMVPGTYKGWPLPMGSFPGKRSEGNLLLAGDAGSFVDPVTGEGLYFAVRTGLFAARAMEKALMAGNPLAASVHYERLWKRAFNFRDFVPGYFIQKLLSSPALINGAVRQLARNPRLASRAAGVISHTIPRTRLLF